MSLTIKVLCPKCRDYNLHECVIDPETGEVTCTCTKCKRALTTDVAPEGAGAVFVPSRIPHIEKSIQSAMDKVEKPLFCGREVSAIYRHLAAVTAKTREQLTSFRVFPLFHTDAFIRGDRARDNSPMEKLNFTIEYCNVKISTFMRNKDAGADRGKLKEKKREALKAEREVREKLAVLNQEKDRAATSLERTAKEMIAKRRMGRNANYARLFTILKKD